MANRIEIATKVNDTRSEVMKNHLRDLGYKINQAKVIEVYTVNKDFSSGYIHKIADLLANPISQEFIIDKAWGFQFDFALEIGFLPGVTDNAGGTARESIEDLFKIKFSPEENVHTSRLILISGTDLHEQDIEKIATTLANDLIQRIHIKNFSQYKKDGGMDLVIPKVTLKPPHSADEVNLEVSEEELIKLGKEGIPDSDGTRRGPLALEKEYLEAIKDYFDKEGRSPKDIELESIAQTWSEHCKHTIFASAIDEVTDGLYKHYIKRATFEIRQKKGKDDICVSVFSDNAGGIIFDENWIVTDKAETHNSPSALDPFGGAITGIVGVNRDCVGFGKGAKPVINKYGFCVGNPQDEEPIYRDKERKIKALPPKRILGGIVEGVNHGGNCSGIPTPQGFLCFDENYKGKPLVFVGTVGLIPKEINGQPSYKKSAKVGDKIVMIGGRVGQDGIHGATFSSEALTSGSPATAVQIGDPITQKKLSDAIIKEARDRDLYNSITDNGAGGLSCSVAEMARECGGCEVELNKVPLKYPNLEPWKIWISESQERMTLSVPAEKIQEFTELMGKRGVEVSVIGTFTDSGRCVVKYNGETIMDLEMEFLHDGIPKKNLQTTYSPALNKEPDFPEPKNLSKTLLQMLSRNNICSFEFISKQYDHNVQGGAVIGPVQGRGRVNGPSSVTKPVLNSDKGVICSQGINPNYSRIDTYHMAACAIDTAIRNIIATGGTLDHLALMDNFCWCSSDEPERLGELKAAVKACYDYAVAYETPYISGKDSMYNDFYGYDKNGNDIKISVPPTLLISSLGVIGNVLNAITLDVKMPGDLIYILGETKKELGGSEYFAMHNEIGNEVPKVDAQKAINLYKKFTKSVEQNLISSALSPQLGGIAVTLAKKAIAGQLGMEVDLSKVPTYDALRNDYLLFSESQSRFIVTVAPENKEKFEKAFEGEIFAEIGKVREDGKFIIKTDNQTIIETEVNLLEESYKKTFKNY